MPKSFLCSYWKSIVVCIIIFILSTVTFKTIPDVAKFQNSDKLTHALMYAGLGFIFYFEYSKDVRRNTNYCWLIYPLLFFVFWGGLIEVLQGTLFKPRTAELGDWIADIIGLLAGTALAKWLLSYKKVKKIVHREKKNE